MRCTPEMLNACFLSFNVENDNNKVSFLKVTKDNWHSSCGVTHDFCEIDFTFIEHICG